MQANEQEQGGLINIGEDSVCLHAHACPVPVKKRFYGFCLINSGISSFVRVILITVSLSLTKRLSLY